MTAPTLAGLPAEKVAELRAVMDAAAAREVPGGDYIGIMLHAAPKLLVMAEECLLRRALDEAMQAEQYTRHVLNEYEEDTGRVRGEQHAAMTTEYSAAYTRLSKARQALNAFKERAQ